MKTARLSRIADASGLLTAGLVIVGFVASVAAGRAEVSLASTREEVAQALSDPVGAGLWAGIALESVGLLALVLFGAALAARLSGWIRYAVVGTAVTFAAVSLAAMGAVGVYERLAGPGVDAAVTHAFVNLAGILYAGTWLIGALLLTLVAASTLFGRWLASAAVTIAVFSIAGLIAPTSDLAQIPAFLQLLWIAAASIGLLRREPAGGGANQASRQRWTAGETAAG